MMRLCTKRIKGLEFESFIRLWIESSDATAQAQHQVQRRLLLDVIVRKGTPILKLLPCEDQALLIRWDSFLVLDFRLDIAHRVRSLNVQGDGLAGESLHEDLHATAQAQHQVQRPM